MLKYLISVDFIGQKPGLLIKGSRMHKTIFGGCLSLLTGFILAAAVSYFFYTLFSRTSFTVMLNEEYNPKPFKSWMNGEFSIILMDKYFNDIPNKGKLYDIYADFWWNKPTTYENGTTTYGIVLQQIKLETCNVSKHFPQTPELWNDQKLINQSTCMARDQDFYSSNLFGANNYTGVVFWIHKCINTTNKTDCAPDDVIQAALTNVFILVRFKDYYFDHNLVGDTAVPYIYSDQTMASITAYKRTWYTFRNIDYISDAGLIFTNNLDYEYSNFVTTRDATDLRINPTVLGTFAVISLNMHILKQIYLRKFYKVQNMIVDLGGLIKGIILMATILNLYTRDKLFYKKIMNKNIHSYSSLKNDHINKSLVTLLNNFKDKENLNMNNKSDTKNLKEETPDSLLNIKTAQIQQNLTKKNLINNFYVFNKLEISPIKTDTGNKVDTKIVPHEILVSKQFGNATLGKIKLSKLELILPFFCISKFKNPSKTLLIMEMLRKSLEETLDVNQIISKLNMVDKLTYIVAGDKYKNLLSMTMNPYLNTNEPKGDIMTSINQDDLNRMAENMAVNLKNLTEKY